MSTELSLKEKIKSAIDACRQRTMAMEKKLEPLRKSKDMFDGDSRVLDPLGKRDSCLQS